MHTIKTQVPASNKMIQLRFLVACAILLTSSCTGQHPGVAQGQLDTIKLFDPKPDTEIVHYEPADIYKNCIVIRNGLFFIVINQVQQLFSSEQGLAGYIESHS